ncbi:hypothetical protein VTK56DRAFT_4209 [Thermocarpiscus australiensis]
MKSPAFLVACGAVLAAAGPILQDRRLHIKTETVVEWVTVTVTEGDAATVFLRPNPRPKTTTTSITTSSTSVAPPPPPPPPPPSSTPEAVIQSIPEPTPEPAPQPAPSPSPSPSPEPAPSPAPVVEAAKPSSAPAPAPTTEPAPSQPSDYASTALYHHNVHRYNHSASALEWSEEHAQYAATLAARCVFAHDTSIGGGGYGQNLAMWGSSGDPQALGANKAVAQAASDGWYNGELNLFPASDYGKDTPDMSGFEQWGHFSQLVWKGTRKVGCATQFCQPGTISSMGSWYTVCNYFPAGNVGGAYGENVLPPEGQPAVAA